MTDTSDRPPTRSVPRLVTASLVGALATVGTTFLPWASSGDRARSSYQVMDVAERAGVLPTSAASAVELWLLLPVLCGIVVLAASLRKVRLVALTTGTIGIAVATGAVLVARSPLVVEPGLVLGAGAGLCTTGIGIITLITTARRST